MTKRLLSCLVLIFCGTLISKAQQITKTLIGSSYNMYSVLSPSTNPVHANNALGTISFTHRQNSNLPGGSGVIQTSWSTDEGSTWQYVLQPTNDTSQYNRYPSGLIIDPSGNNDLNSAHAIVAGPTTSTASSGWVGIYFYNMALDGTGGREFNLLDADTQFPSFTRNSMMADKNNIVRVLGYEDNNLILTAGEYNPNGASYYTNYVYASSVSYYVGETVDATTGAVTTPAAWGPVEPINLGDTIFYMTSPNPDMFFDGTIDVTWTNEIEIINYGNVMDSTWTGDWSVDTTTSVFIDSTIVDSVMLVDTLSSTTYDTTTTSSFDSTLVDSTWVIDTVMTTTYDTTTTISYDSTYTYSFEFDTSSSTSYDSTIVMVWNFDTLTTMTYDTTYSSMTQIDSVISSTVDSMISITYDSTYVDSTSTWVYDTLSTMTYDTTLTSTYDTSYVNVMSGVDTITSTSIDTTMVDQWNVTENFVAIDTLNVWNNVANYEDESGTWVATTFEYDSFYVETVGATDSTLFEGGPGYYWEQQSLTTEGLVEFYDYSMAFNQDGDIGYVVHQGTDASGQIVPFVHFSSDAGATWTKLDHDFSTVQGYILPAYNGGIDCTVDKFGDLHMISCLFEADASIEETNRKVYDIVVNSSTWSANWIADISTERVLDTDPAAINGIGYNHRIQAARSTDGSKVFAVWTDVNTEEFGEMDKIEYPDIYAFGKDLETGMVTGITNFTKYTVVEGSSYWMYTSPIVYDDADGTTYHLPSTISEAGTSELDPMEHFYIGGIHFSDEDFSIANWNLDVNDFATMEVKTYPNPASNFTTISLYLESSADVSISILNTLGQEMYFSNENYKNGQTDVTIDLNNFEAGVYFYTVYTNSFSTTKRLIVR